MKNIWHHYLLTDGIKMGSAVFIEKKFYLLLYILFLCVNSIVAGSISDKTVDWSLLESNDTLVLYFKEKRAGMVYYNTQIDSSEKIIHVRSCVNVAPCEGIADAFSSMNISEIRDYDFNGKLISAVKKLRSAGGESVWKLKKNESGKWILTVVAGGLENSRAVDNVHSTIETSYEINSAIKKGNITVGKEWQQTDFELTEANHHNVTIKCIAVPGIKNENYVFVNRDNIINRDERWEIDTNGNIVFQEVPPFFTAKRYFKGNVEKENEEKSFIDLEEIANLFKISAEHPKKNNETIALSLEPGAKIHKSVMRFYICKDNKYILKNPVKKCYDKKNANEFEYKADWLSSTVTIQSGHPEIKKLSVKLKASMERPCEIIEHFNNYIYRNIEKKNVASFSNAYETLKTGFGDCGEHAVLLAALLRAAEIEANVVLGLIYMPERQGYFYHAWVVVYNTGKLLFTDPALGKFPAAEGYVPLIIDSDGTNIIHLASLIERIEISYIPKLNE